MVTCKHCQISNSLDSTFCKHCGTSLPADDVAEARQKLEETIAQGYSSFNDGKTIEAMMIAEVAVEADPVSTSALSLKGMCHEREGQVAEALDCYEKVVNLNPDSALDKIKVNQLRNMLANRLAAPPPSNRPFMAAVAAAVLVVSIGSLMAMMNTRKPETKLVADNSQSQPQVQSFDQPRINPAQTNPGATTPTAPVQQGVVQQPVGDKPVPNPGTGLAPYSGARLPAPNGGATSVVDDGGTQPFRVPGVELKKMGDGPTAPAAGRGVDPEPSTVTTTGPEPKRDNPGTIEISVKNGGPRTSGGSQDVSGNGAEALARAALNQFQVGNYQAAANTFERALKYGGDQGTINQRLGQCYDRMGRKADAANAYSHAIDAYQALVSGGRASERTKAALDSCKQALKVLQGS